MHEAVVISQNPPVAEAWARIWLRWVWPLSQATATG